MTKNDEEIKDVGTYQHLGIGRRLKHVKENDLAHGEFGKWLEKVKLTNQQAHRFMKVSQEYENSNLTTSLNLGLNVLYQIATLPEPERTKEHTTSKGAKLVKTCHFNTHIERIRTEIGIYSVRFRNVSRT
ncbi:DUF3102 domain-containing protein [Staphylococcus epidermidis]|nr:DUF3102 domain-containing protein [Staphylococcus epidermidis]MBM6246766.1 DUF3102 domain-containing protein [Staphylococcus epidermidis]MBM6249015.1 DUF3102 domain-containing protein [Staphylococcus epidermidis]MBM6253428.1 DUF3102 domain-containing protein [Staphylococcus epidermidis]MBM6255692.1 DUF3102 domain-containing protein [Staphylococcus epidermidis]